MHHFLFFSLFHLRTSQAVCPPGQSDRRAEGVPERLLCRLSLRAAEKLRHGPR